MINLLLVLDNEPRFIDTVSEVPIYDTKAVGDKVYQLSPSDNDADDVALLNLTMAAHEYFSLNGNGLYLHMHYIGLMALNNL